MMLRNDFAFFEVSAAAAALGQPGGADQLASQGRRGRLHPGRQRRQDPGLSRRPAAADPGRRARRRQGAGGATPPEIAAAFNVAPELTQVPDGMTDWDRWRDACAIAGRPRSDGAPMFYTSGTTGRPKGVRRQANAARYRPGLERVLASPWRQAERRSGRADERPDVSLGAEPPTACWRSAAWPQHGAAGASTPRTCCD